MNNFSELMQQSATHAWLYIPSAILLGILHGLEPGHSKTLMAAFIVAIRGTVKQAILLGLAATISHTAIVWLIALGGMYISQQFNQPSVEGWLQLVSACIVLLTAIWMFVHTWLGEFRWKKSMQMSDHHHEDHHHDESEIIHNALGTLTLSINEEGQLPHWRIDINDGYQWDAKDIVVQTTRDDGRVQQFSFSCHAGVIQSTVDIPEPHQFEVSICLSHQNQQFEETFYFEEHHHHHDHAALTGLTEGTKEYQDAHEKAHAHDIEKRFSNKSVTTWQIILFGLTGGLIPCPAAITVLLLCLQVKEIALGATLVLCFGIGLAITLVSVGAMAAVAAKKASERWSGLSTIARRAPYASSILIALVGGYMAYHGWLNIQ